MIRRKKWINEIYHEPKIDAAVKSGRLQWLGYIEKIMDDKENSMESSGRHEGKDKAE